MRAFANALRGTASRVMEALGVSDDFLSVVAVGEEEAASFVGVGMACRAAGEQGTDSGPVPMLNLQGLVKVMHGVPSF